MKTKIKKETIVFMISIIIRLLLIVAAVALFMLYSPPLLTLGVINAGNLFGLGISGLLVIYSLLFTRINKFISGILGNTSGKIILSFIALAVIIFFTAFFITLTNIISHSHYTADNQTTVIVLGCQIRGDKPSYSLKKRCDAASEYMKNHPDAVAIASGGQGYDENLSEGQCIYNLMTESGIDGNRIIIEDKSTSTDTNVKNSLKIIEDNNMSKEVAVATTDYHQYRASMICRKNGLSPSSLPSNSTKPSKPTFFTREVFGVWIQRLQGVRN
ncbi:MAG: YdcF family protein [Eubacterium sp.]|nr:YdcF family protein [Eubacterium sp.]